MKVGILFLDFIDLLADIDDLLFQLLLLLRSVLRTDFTETQNSFHDKSSIPVNRCLHIIRCTRAVSSGQMALALSKHFSRLLSNWGIEAALGWADDDFPDDPPKSP